MQRLDRQAWLLAVCLSALAGYVDALGFIELGGFFVSFMSGNSTRLAVGIAEDAGDATLAGGLILAFVAGVFLGTLFRRHFAQHQQKIAALSFLTISLFVAAILHVTGAGQIALFAMAFAMGSENTVFERDGEVAIGLTYMTGALVKLGQKLAAALRGEERGGWFPFLTLWMGLVGGAVTGALIHPVWGLNSLWIAVLFAAGLTVWRAGKRSQ